MKKLFWSILCLFFVRNCYLFPCFKLIKPFKEETKDQWVVEKDSIKKAVDFYRKGDGNLYKTLDGNVDKNRLRHYVIFFDLKNYKNESVPDLTVDITSYLSDVPSDLFEPSGKAYVINLGGRLETLVQFIEDSLKSTLDMLVMKGPYSYKGMDDSNKRIKRMDYFKYMNEKRAEIFSKIKDGKATRGEAYTEFQQLMIKDVLGISLEQIKKAATMIAQDFVRIVCPEEKEKAEEASKKGNSKSISIGM